MDLFLVAPHPSSPFHEAEERQRQGDLEGAAALYERLVLEHPKQAAAHHNYAMTLRKLNRLEDALRQSKIAFKLTPGHATLAFSLGLSFEKTGYLTEAEDTICIDSMLFASVIGN